VPATPVVGPTPDHPDRVSNRPSWSPAPARDARTCTALARAAPSAFSVRRHYRRFRGGGVRPSCDGEVFTSAGAVLGGLPTPRVHRSRHCCDSRYNAPYARSLSGYFFGAVTDLPPHAHQVMIKKLHESVRNQACLELATAQRNETIIPRVDVARIRKMSSNAGPCSSLTGGPVGRPDFDAGLVCGKIHLGQCFHVGDGLAGQGIGNAMPVVAAPLRCAVRYDRTPDGPTRRPDRPGPRDHRR
jgi:hypothetical protein